MLARASTIILAVAAIALAAPQSASSSQCDTGTLQCCSQVVPANTLGALAGLLDVGNILGSVGLNCSPITALVVGPGPSCSQQPVCCTDVSQNGLVNLGCSPIDLNL